jgi:NTP pyrophosphatase (non-canonical NTP hydrolase)
MADVKPIGMAVFRKNLLKTVNVKASRRALKYTARRNQKIAIAHLAMSVSGNVGEVLGKMNQYLLGFQLTGEHKQDLKDPFGDLGANLVLLCRFLKVKTPTTTKKSKLMGTPGSALLELESLAAEMLRTVNEALFQSPKTKEITKQVMIPKTGQKEMRTIPVIDVEAEAVAEKTREEHLRLLTAHLVDLYWKLCLKIYGQPPAFLFHQKLERLAAANPNFQLVLSEQKKGKGGKPKKVKANVNTEEPVAVPA